MEVRMEVRSVERLEAFSMTALDTSVSEVLEGIRTQLIEGRKRRVGCTDQ